VVLFLVPFEEMRMRNAILILFVLLLAIVLSLALIAFFVTPRLAPATPGPSFSGPTGTPFVNGPNSPPPSLH
jgi:hypothetical protein